MATLNLRKYSGLHASCSVPTAALNPKWRPSAIRASHAGRTCNLYDLHDSIIPYQQAWDWQHLLVDRCLASSAALATDGHGPPGGTIRGNSLNEQGGTSGMPRDSVLILQHAPVYTLGAGSTMDNLLFDPKASSIPLLRTERGGEVTYHGPGQV